ncbi:hypothetical protein JW868_01475 [Candidatus Woesearchaeota archaeon]|nr:hypothetical protein [Candidatus Woesearchaeota archaeon]
MTRQRRQVEAMFSFLAGGIDCWPKQYLLHPDLELIRFEIDHALYSQAVTRAERYYTRHYRPKHPSEPASLQTLLISRMLTCVQGLSSYPEFFG